MAQIIKVRFLRNEIPTGMEYTYYSKELLKIGDTVQINSSAKGVVTRVDVSEEEIKDFKHRMKFIVGKAKEEEGAKNEQ